MVAISVPVWDAERKNVIGVLARTTHLGDLRDEYAGSIRVQEGEDVTRSVAIIDRRDGQLLDHEWMTVPNLRRLSREQLASLKVPERTMTRLRLGLPRNGQPPPRTTAARCPNYHDPVGSVDEANYGGQWLAAFAHVGDIGWTAVVQEEREAALRPVNEMRQGLVQYGLFAVVASCTLIGLLWYFVYRAMNERHLRFPLVRNGNGTASSGSGSAWARGSDGSS
jgi:eukaryotic-like serine/threonine-protein kinase